MIMWARAAWNRDERSRLTYPDRIITGASDETRKRQTSFTGIFPVITAGRPELSTSATPAAGRRAKENYPPRVHHVPGSPKDGRR